MKILIATAKSPAEGQAHEVFSAIRGAAGELGLIIPAFLWCAGPGCTNLAFEILGGEIAAEEFANQIAMVLMPSKWCETSDELPDKDTVTL